MTMYKLHKNQQGIIHHLALIILAVLVISGISFTGYKVYQAKYGISAKAYNWTTAISYDKSWVKICVLDLGSSWNIKGYAHNADTTKRYGSNDPGTRFWEVTSLNTVILSGTLGYGATSSYHGKIVKKTSILNTITVNFGYVATKPIYQKNIIIGGQNIRLDKLAQKGC